MPGVFHREDDPGARRQLHPARPRATAGRTACLLHESVIVAITISVRFCEGETIA